VRAAARAQRIGVATLLLVVTFVALLLVFPRGGDNVSEECREARERANRFVKWPNAARVDEMRRICESTNRE
jgi:hypothetical protein